MKLLLVSLVFGIAVDAARLSRLRTTPTAKNESADTTLQKVKVEFFFESMCPYCHQFMINVLAVAWSDPEIRKRLDLHLYPYGNAQTVPLQNVSKGYQFWHDDMPTKNQSNVFNCQHGSEECFGNTVYACAIKKNSLDIAVPFIDCMMKRNNVSAEWSSFECAREMDVNLEEIKECANGGEGNTLLAEAGASTKALEEPAGPQKYVPWVVINGTHSPGSEQDAAGGESHNFMSTLCGLFEGTKPAACTKLVQVSATNGTVGSSSSWNATWDSVMNWLPFW